MVQIIQRWRAFDGEEFDTEQAALDHEAAHFQTILIDLTRAEIDAALERAPHALAISDALEKAGAIIARKRRDSGELRRARNGEGKSTPQETAPGQTTTDPAPQADSESVRAAEAA